jgi:hypothetical protein
LRFARPLTNCPRCSSSALSTIFFDISICTTTFCSPDYCNRASWGCSKMGNMRLLGMPILANSQGSADLSHGAPRWRGAVSPPLLCAVLAFVLQRVPPPYVAHLVFKWT